jgi:DNA polymerase-3 subunit alpha
MDDLGKRGTLLNSVERIISLAQREQKLRDTGQSTMFDMFGATASVPLPGLELTPSDVTDREKAFWEKELMGVSFSEKPFSPVFSSKDINAVFCGNINAELDKQVIVTAGRVISARFRSPKERSFVIAVIETSVVKLSYRLAQRLPRPAVERGNELVVGEVRARDDEVTLICDSAGLYQPPQDEKEPAAAPVVKAAEPRPEPAAKAPAGRQRLIINIPQTADKEGDVARLGKIIAALKGSPGRDEVQINVLNGGPPIPLKLPA